MSIKTYFTPLLGALDDGPLCYLLEVDECRLLLDCGWDDSFNISQLSRLEDEIKKGFDAVIVTHPDLAHIGALPYAVGKLGLTAPIYATAAISKFGKLMFYDIHNSKTIEEEFEIFSMDDVDLAFENVIELRYDQPVSLEQYDIEMIPHCAGHLIGGTFWKIQKETEKIIYAVDYNHGKERHLHPSKITMIERPSLMITDAYNALYRNTKRREIDHSLLTCIEETVQKQGDILLPVDTAGRVLELLLLLDQEWSKFKLQKATLAFLCHTSYSTQDFAKSNLEWMNLKLENGENPFDFHNVTTCSKIEELDDLPKPRIVLATLPTLEFGFSRSLFVSWCENSNNLIILTTKQRKKCFSSQLKQWIKKRTHPTSSIYLTIKQRKRVPLEGKELEEYLKDIEDAKKEKNINEDDINDDDNNDIDMIDSIQEDPEEIIPLLPTSFFDNNSFDLIPDSISDDNNTFRKAHPMFPYYEENIEWDAYGEQVDWESIKQNEQQTDEEMYDIEDDDDDMDLLLGEEENIIPTKPIIEDIKLKIQCIIKFIDLDGRSDGLSMKNVLSAVSPSKVVLIHGFEKACNELLTQCKKTTGCKNTEFLIPKLGEHIDVSSGTMIFKLKVSEALTNSLRYSFVDGCNVAYITGKIDFRPTLRESLKSLTNNENNDNNNNNNEIKQEQQMEPYLQDLSIKQKPGHNAVIMGSLRLVEFKNHLLTKGYSAELKQGSLICNNSIIIKKNRGASQFEIDGPLCNDYYVIRDLLYKQFSVL